MEKAVRDLAEYYEVCTAGNNCAADNAKTHVGHKLLPESTLINGDEFLQKMADHRGYCESGLQKLIRERRTEGRGQLRFFAFKSVP